MKLLQFSDPAFTVFFITKSMSYRGKKQTLSSQYYSHENTFKENFKSIFIKGHMKVRNGLV
jgi:hypothetical protein